GIHVGDTDETDGHGQRHGRDRPGDTDRGGQGDVLDRPDAHVAGEDVRLAEVTKTPGQPGDDDDQAERFGGEPTSGVDVVGQPAEGGDELFPVGGDAVRDLAD